MMSFHLSSAPDLVFDDLMGMLGIIVILFFLVNLYQLLRLVYLHWKSKTQLDFLYIPFRTAKIMFLLCLASLPPTLFYSFFNPDMYFEFLCYEDVALIFFLTLANILISGFLYKAFKRFSEKQC